MEQKLANPAPLGLMEFKKGNTFGVTAFTSYGLFWITLVAIFVLPDVAGGMGFRTAAAF